MPSFRIAAYITAYQDATALNACLQSLQDQSLEEIYILDNSPQTLPIPPSIVPIVHNHQPQNTGIGKGINLALQWAIHQNYHFLWLFDQDSQPAPHCLQTLLNLYLHLKANNIEPGILAPTALTGDPPEPVLVAQHDRYRFIGQPHQRDRSYYRCIAPITSGSLVNLATAKTIVLISEKSLSTLSNSRRKLLGFLAGISMVIKPTILPVTVVLLSSTFIMRLWVDIFVLKERTKIMPIIHNFRVSLLCLLIPVLPYYLFAWQQVFKYIYQNQFVNLKKVWNMYPLPLAERLLYYLMGTGGSMMLGNWIYLWTILVILSIFIFISQKIWKNSDNISLLVPLITSGLIAYTIVTISDHKSPFLGVIIPCFIFFSTILLIVFIIDNFSSIFIQTNISQFSRKMPKTIALWGLTIFCLVSWSLYEWPVKNDLVSPSLESLNNGVRDYQANLLVDLYQDISNDSCTTNSTKNSTSNESTLTVTNCDKSVYLTLITHWLTPDALLYYQYKLGMTTNIYMPTLRTDYGEFNGGALINDIEDQIRGINQATYTIALDLPNPDIASWLPGLKIAELTLNFLDNNPNFLLLNTYKNPYNSSIVYLYKKN